MDKIYVYMMGAISYFEQNRKLYEAIEWRNDLAQKLLDLNTELCIDKFGWFNPTYNFKDNLKYNDETIVKQNIYYLNKCNLGIINIKNLENSPGSMFEIFYYYINHKPVIAFGKNDIFQPHINCSITEWFPTLDDVTNYLRTMYAQ